VGVETMLHHHNILQGVKFTWVMDHKSLTHILDQKGLSGCQACWMECLSEFDFNVLYVPGEENVLPDALSQMYEFNAPRTIQSQEEYLQYDLNIVVVDSTPSVELISVPLLVSQEAITPNVQHSHQLADKHPAHATEHVVGENPRCITLHIGPELGPSSGGGKGQPLLDLGRPAPPELAGTQYPVPYPKGWKPQQPPPPVESGHPETGIEFAARMKDKFVL